MMSATDKNAATPTDLLLIATGAALVLLAIEWLLVSNFGFGLEQGEVARALTGLVSLGLGAGIAACCIALLLRRFTSSHAALAAAVAILLFMEVYAALGNAPWAKLLGAGGFASVAFLVLVRLSAKLPAWLLRPAGGLAAASALLALALLQTAGSAVDSTGAWLAAGAAIGAALLVFLWWRGRGERPLLPVVALLTVLVISVVLGLRIPVWQPDNSFAAGKPSVLLVTIDTLRADHVGAYGYARASTPTIDGLAKEGVLFKQAVTANVYTGPSHASILTGLLPKRHGVLTNTMRLQDGVPTLADMLRREGYVSAAFVSAYPVDDSSSALPSRFHAFDDDTRQFRWFPPAISGVAGLHLLDKLVTKLSNQQRGYAYPSYRLGADTADVAIKWLERNAGRPLFTWVHLFDPHLPNHDHGGRSEGEQELLGGWHHLNARQRSEITASPEMTAAMYALYDSEISYADAQLARIVEAARKATPDGQLLVVVTSDHGQMMGEHNLFWSRRLYDPTLMVPLIIVLPGQAAVNHKEIDTQVRLIDLAPTILEILAVDSAEDFDGASLLGLMDGDSTDSPGPAFSSSYPHDSDYERERHSIRDHGWKMIKNYSGWDGERAALPGEVTEELYHLDVDPGETSNLAGSVSGIQQQLGARLDSMDLEVGRQQELHVTPEAREQLRSLGYIQ